jgi:hypothetical protein
VEYAAPGDAAGRAEPDVHHHGAQHCHVLPRPRLHHVRQPALPAQCHREILPTSLNLHSVEDITFSSVLRAVNISFGSGSAKALNLNYGSGSSSY